VLLSVREELFEVHGCVLGGQGALVGEVDSFVAVVVD